MLFDLSLTLVAVGGTRGVCSSVCFQTHRAGLRPATHSYLLAGHQTFLASLTRCSAGWHPCAVGYTLFHDRCEGVVGSLLSRCHCVRRLSWVRTHCRALAVP